MFEALRQFDRALFLDINGCHNSFGDTLMWVLSQSWHTYLLVAIVAYFFYKTYSAKKAAEFVVGCALVAACTDLSTNLVKNNVKRYRPTHNTEIGQLVHTVADSNNKEYRGGKYGFFSAHTANSFGVVMFIFLSMNWIQPKYKLLLFIYPALIGYSRMYLGVHYPLDVATGIVSGLFFGRLIFSLVNRHFYKFNETPA